MDPKLKSMSLEEKTRRLRALEQLFGMNSSSRRISDRPEVGTGLCLKISCSVVQELLDFIILRIPYEDVNLKVTAIGHAMFCGKCMIYFLDTAKEEESSKL